MKIIAGILSVILNGMVMVAIVAVTMANSLTAQEPPKRPLGIYFNDRDHECMAKNIYFESRSDNMAGQFAVADVVLNRVKDKRYPNTVCDVIYEGPVKELWKTKQDPNLPASEREYIPLRHRCQFSWYCDGKKDTIPKYDNDAWERAKLVAGYILYSGEYRGITEGATHYHATYVKPKWRHDRGMNLVGRIGSHIFYRWE
jgi:spore germination cell wall hydrolase CwlJ-like protein|tara:strand:+ start:1147 stop:1746 length:600 start_codon:yes stop_codon:yes gene_type:complete